MTSTGVFQKCMEIEMICNWCKNKVVGNSWMSNGQFNSHKFCSERCADNWHSAQWQAIAEYEDRKWCERRYSQILRHFGLQAYMPRFKSPTGAVIIALLCNAAAKWCDGSLYDYKSWFIRDALIQHENNWSDEGIVYFETPYGQISFHTFDEEDELAADANGREWAGGFMQSNAYDIAHQYLFDGDCEIEEYYYSGWLRSEEQQ